MPDSHDMRAAGDATFDRLTAAMLSGAAPMHRDNTARALLQEIAAQMRADLAAWDNANRLYQQAIGPNADTLSYYRLARCVRDLPPWMASPSLVAEGK